MPTAYAEPVIPAPAVAAAADATDADAATGGGVTAVYRGSSPSAARAAPAERKKSKTCKFPGCNKSIKSQGHCQKHGAKPKRCRVAGCEKQAQGTHDGESAGIRHADAARADNTVPRLRLFRCSLDPVAQNSEFWCKSNVAMRMRMHP